MMRITRIILVATLLVNSGSSVAQIVQFGLKGGGQYSWVRLGDEAEKALVKSSPVTGFNAGLVFAFKVKSRYFLQTELLYSTKGKSLSGIKDPLLHHDVTYNYIDMPILYNIQFKGNIDVVNFKEFKYYIGAGPLISYWLGGNGSLVCAEFYESSSNPEPMDYSIKFGQRGDNIDDEYSVYVNNANRLQVGLNVGGGLLLEPTKGSRIMVDLRFEYGHSWLGQANSVDFGGYPVEYRDNLKVSNMGLRFSVAYLYEINMNKKSRNKGKSNSKVKNKGTSNRKKGNGL